MTDKYIYLVNGILSDPNDPNMWAHLGKKWFVARGVVKEGNADGYSYHADVEGGPAHNADRGSSSAMNAIYDDLHDAMSEGLEIHLVGHSNGVWLILLVLFLFPELRVATIHLIAGATKDDCDQNHLNQIMARGQVGKVYFYTSPMDDALGIGNLLGYGLLGKVGPHNVSDALRAAMDEYVRMLKHSAWVDEELERTLQEIAAAVLAFGGAEQA